MRSYGGRMADAADRARAWSSARTLQVCDRVESWEHGTLVRCTRHPTYYDLNKVIWSGGGGLSAADLAARADAWLRDAGYRRIDVLDADEAARVRPGLEALDYRAVVVVWMLHDGGRPPGGSEVAVEPVDFEDVLELRREWHAEDPTGDFEGFYPQYREVALGRGAVVLAARAAGRPVAYAQLDGDERTAEIAEVFVSPAHRGRGLGRALTAAAIAAAADREELWISADAEGRPWRLYERLGFQRVWTVTEFQRAPVA